MDEHLKQRLVGALVLLSTAVIFLPLVFDGRDGDASYHEIQIPAEPVVTLDVTEPSIDRAYFAAVQQAVEADRELSADSTLAQQPSVKSEESIDATPLPVPAEEASSGGETAVKKAEEIAARQDFATIKAAAKAPANGIERLAETYTIQLAAFSSRENASKLHKKLIDKDYKAYIEQNSGNGKTLYRVFVGPQLRKQRAEVIAGALEQEFHLKGIVVRYAP